MNLVTLLRFPREIVSLPEVTVRLYGDDNCRKIFDNFIKPHPRYKFIQNKRWGVGLLLLPDVFEHYLKEIGTELIRRKRKRSLSLGYHFETINPLNYLVEILSINESVKVRQGRRMDPEYLNIESLRAFFEGKPVVYGVFDTTGVLKAYAHTPICGDLFIFSRLLGHGNDLDNGVMYLLITEVIREMIERKRRQGSPVWAMYDTFFGASKGLRYFKERLGFKPYKVRWLWERQY